MSASNQYRSLSSELSNNETLELQSAGENLDAVLRLLPLREARTVLDVGCGTGAMTRALARRLPQNVEIWGLDLSADHVEYAARTAEREAVPNVRYLVGDIVAPPAELPGSFDLLCEKYVLMSIVPSAASRRFLFAMKQLLRPGGVLALIEADINFGQDRYPPPPEPLRSVLPRIVNFYRDSETIEWRCGVRLYDYLTKAGFAGVRLALAEGRIMQGGLPRTLVDHACADVEQLIHPCLDAAASVSLLHKVARQWRDYLRDQGSFVYNPIFVGTGIAV